MKRNTDLIGAEGNGGGGMGWISTILLLVLTGEVIAMVVLQFKSSSSKPTHRFV